MPPQQAGEISMRMHSGEQKQPLPCQVPAISFGESSLGRSCPWLMAVAARSRGRVRAGELITGVNLYVATMRPERGSERIGTDRIGSDRIGSGALRGRIDEPSR